MIRKTEERSFYFKQLGSNSFAGMTYKNAGNFYPAGNTHKANKLAQKVLTITGFYYLNNELLVMRAVKSAGEVFYFNKTFRSQVFCDGLIFKGRGAAMLFPGGCPVIAFRDRNANISGLLHGSWQAVANGVINNFINKWKGAGGKPGLTEIKFLPAVCRRCLHFDVDYFKKISTLFKKNINAFVSPINKRYVMFDLVGLIETELNKFGYRAKNDAVCVNCGDNFYFYRRDDKGKEKYRNAAFIITN